jgi:hypothetical protein
MAVPIPAVFQPYLTHAYEQWKREITAALDEFLILDAINMILTFLPMDGHLDFLHTQAEVLNLFTHRKLSQASLAATVRASGEEWEQLLTPDCPNGWFNGDGHRAYDILWSYRLSLNELCRITQIASVRVIAERKLPDWFKTYRHALWHNGITWADMAHL